MRSEIGDRKYEIWSMGNDIRNMKYELWPLTYEIITMGSCRLSSHSCPATDLGRGGAHTGIPHNVILRIGSLHTGILHTGILHSGSLQLLSYGFGTWRGTHWDPTSGMLQYGILQLPSHNFGSWWRTHWKLTCWDITIWKPTIAKPRLWNAATHTLRS